MVLSRSRYPPSRERTLSLRLIPKIGFTVFDLADPSRNSAVNITGQTANCWSAYSPKTGHYFLTDPGAAIINEVQVDGNLKGSLVKVIASK